MTTVGFVGLGQIGRPMAERLDAPVVYDVRADATAGFAHVAGDVKEVAERCDVVSVMVRDDAQVREVVTELLPAARPGNVIAVHSTISPGTAEELAAAAGDVHVVDVPVSGGAIGASQGSLAALFGGDQEAFERCRAAFSPWASRVIRFGPVGAGTRAKLALNLLIFSAFAAAAESQRLAEAAGIDLIELGNAVRHSDSVTGGVGAIMFRDTTAPVGADDPVRGILEHTRDLGEKDLGLALALADALDVDLPIARMARDVLATGLGVPHG
jgi:3-hydroxyisobutyrate dehydrogenase-like beta-hydroxyacid dehydrogenase